MRTLALDIGLRRTGIAFLDDAIGISLPLKTLSHTTVKELTTELENIIRERHIDRLVVGLPLLPSGEEGEQASHVRSVCEKLQTFGLPIVLRDERYTTPPTFGGKHSPPGSSQDPDAAAACALLGT